MIEIIHKYDYILYVFWIAAWLVISQINTSIYRNYNAQAIEAFENFAPNHEGKLLVFFTFRWTVDQNDTIKISKLKKALNKMSILFVLLTIVSATLFLYKLNHIVA